MEKSQQLEVVNESEKPEKSSETTSKASSVFTNDATQGLS